MKKNLIFLGLVSLFFWHVCATVLYVAPANPLTPLYLPVVERYMTPLFSQNWNLFAPEPATSSLQFWYRCRSSAGRWSDWRDPIARLIRQHRENRFTPRGKLIYVYQSIARRSLNRYLKHSDMERFERDPAFRTARRFTSDLCSSEGMTDQAQFQVVKVFSRNFSLRHSPGPGKIEYIPFRVFSL